MTDPTTSLARRGFLGRVTGFLAATTGALRSPLSAGPPIVASRPPAEDIYTRLLGVRPVVGAFETWSRYGNRRLAPNVWRAMEEAGRLFVNVDDLNLAAGRKIAGLVEAEDALVTSCAFGAMVLGAAACLTGDDPTKVEALPHPTWPRRECLIQKGDRFYYDRAYQVAGMTLVEVETGEDLVQHITDRTAMIAGLAMVERDLKPGTLRPDELVAIGKRAGVPVLIDAAGEIPPADRLTRYTRMGADLVALSGGKGIGGPSSTGILAGRGDLIRAARLHLSPNQQVGRGMKVNREEIVGLVVALEEFVKSDHAAMTREWTRKARYIADRLAQVHGLNAELRDTGRGYHDLTLRWDRAVIPLEWKDLDARLKAGNPPVVIMPPGIKFAYDYPTIVPSSLGDGEEQIVAAALVAAFRAG